MPYAEVLPEQISALIPSFEEVSALSGSEQDDLLLGLERILRITESAIASVVDHADETGHFSADAHRNVGAWLQAVTNCSGAERIRRVRTTKVLRKLPEVKAEFGAGRLSVAAAGEFGRLYSNLRVRDFLPGSESILLEAAQDLELADFRQTTHNWEMHADIDGAHKRHEIIHETRNARLFEFGSEFTIEANCGAIQGTIIETIWNRFTEAEFQSDLDQVKAESPNAPIPLPRTGPQRRMDALVAIFEAAAAAPVEGRPVQTIVNYVIDDDTFRETISAMGGEPVTPQPEQFLSRHSHTAAGVPIDPQHIVLAALAGQVRRLVITANSIITDQSRTKRVYTGPLRDTIAALNNRCLWLGCNLRSQICQLDHATPAARGGPTTPENAAIACRKHNQHKSSTHITRRLPNGAWITTRPDGTLLASPDTHVDR